MDTAVVKHLSADLIIYDLWENLTITIKHLPLTSFTAHPTKKINKNKN